MDLGIDFSTGDGLPPGVHLVYLSNASFRYTQGGCTFLDIEMVVGTGPLEGRSIRESLAYLNHSKTAQQIGRGKWKRLCVGALGLLDRVDDDLDQVLMRSFCIRSAAPDSFGDPVRAYLPPSAYPIADSDTCSMAHRDAGSGSHPPHLLPFRHL
jgi:hypothetical protein